MVQLYLTHFPFAHLPYYTLFAPPPPQILHNLGFHFTGYNSRPREIENNGYAKFWGANKLHFGKCASGVLAPGNVAEKCVLKLFEQFSDHCCAIKS